MTPILKTFDIGDVLAQTFNTVFTNIVSFMIIVGLVQTPALVVGYFYRKKLLEGEFHFGLFLGQVATSFLVFIATAAVTYGVFEHLRGKRAGLADCLAVGLRRLFPVLGVSFLLGLLVGLGFLLLIVPGIILYVMLFVSVPAVVVERPGVVGALERSRELTRGFRWHVFGVALILLFVAIVLTLPMGALFAFAPLAWYAILAQWVVNVFNTALSATAMAVTYYHLRSVKEQFDVEAIASVFA